MAVGRLAGASYVLDAPEPVGQVASFLSRLDSRANDRGPFIVGFDFPIGVPASYARCAGFHRFLDQLPLFGTGQWSTFYDVASTSSEVSPHRPFYPFGTHGTCQAHLTSALGVAGIRQLLRSCERGNSSRSDASPLFWTLGPKQVGRAAIVGWRDVIAPALIQPNCSVSVWPFHGELDDLLRKSRCVIVETYPAEACLHLGLPSPGRGWSKRSQVDRQRLADILLKWAFDRGVTISDKLGGAIRNGFGSHGSGEDQFDSVLGLMSMTEVLLGHRSCAVPLEPAIHAVEGWIFGQAPAQ